MNAVAAGRSRALSFSFPGQIFWQVLTEHCSGLLAELEEFQSHLEDKRKDVVNISSQ